MTDDERGILELYYEMIVVPTKERAKQGSPISIEEIQVMAVDFARRLRAAWLAEMKPVAWQSENENTRGIFWSEKPFSGEYRPLYALPDAAPKEKDK